MKPRIYNENFCDIACSYLRVETTYQGVCDSVCILYDHAILEKDYAESKMLRCKTCKLEEIISYTQDEIEAAGFNYLKEIVKELEIRTAERDELQVRSKEIEKLTNLLSKDSDYFDISETIKTIREIICANENDN